MEIYSDKIIPVVNVTRIANIHYFEFNNEYSTETGNHPFRELVYVDNGTIWIDSDNFNGALTENHLVIHTANENHRLECIGKIAPNVIIIGFECKAPALDIYSKNPISLSSEQQRILADIIKEGRNVFFSLEDDPNPTDMKKREEFLFGADQMIKIKLEMFLIDLIRDGQFEGKNIGKAISDGKTEEIHSFIIENYKKNINLDELCFVYNTNKTTLCKKFKSEYKETIIEYINKLRIKEAKKLLREGDMNLTKIATEIGFSSVHYLSRIFKKYEGVSPTQYIKNIKERLEIK